MNKAPTRSLRSIFIPLALFMCVLLYDIPAGVQNETSPASFTSTRQAG